MTWRKAIRASWVILLPLPWILQRLISLYPSAVEYQFSRQLFPILRWLPLHLTSLVPFSLTELAVLLLPVGLAILIAVAVRRSRQHRLGLWMRRTVLRFGWLLTISAWLFMLLHGFNYAREPVATSFNLPMHARSTSEVATLIQWTAQQAQSVRTLCETDSQGVFQLSEPMTQILTQANAGYQSASRLWPLLRGPYARPKGVQLSYAWSFTGITGLYMPLWAEANVNISQPDYTIPATINHELAHTLGFAREDEAGFIGFLAGINSPYADVRYSVYADATARLLGNLAAVDPQLYQIVAADIPESLWRDFAAANIYWQQFEGPVRETATQVNHSYLQANMQTDGVHSYGRMSDLLLSWFEQNKRAMTLPEALPKP